MPSDVITAIQNQNTEVAAGEIGGMPQPRGADAQRDRHRAIAAADPRAVPQHHRQGRSERGARVCSATSRASSWAPTIIRRRSAPTAIPGAGIGISLEPGANALRTANLVKAKVAEIAPRMPQGYDYAYANDTTDFIKLSIWEVVKTLFEAILLVVLVMFVFLQSWRATLIPFIAVPVVLLGTFAILYALGFSINTMTLFGLVLATGLLVDDAIVVVENVERLMDENPEMTPREATIASMEQIQMALVAIALVLSAVFLPMVFFGGSTGVIYRQFSATIVSAMVLSVFIALTLSPAIAANLLRRNHATVEETLARAHGARASRTRSNAAGSSSTRASTAWSTGTSARSTGSSTANGCSLPSTPASVAAADDSVRSAPDRLPADRGSGRGAGPVPPARGRDHDPHARGAARGRGLFPERAREEERQNLFHRRRRRPGRGGPEHRPGVHQPRRLRQAQRAARIRADAIVAARFRRIPRACATRRCSRSFPARSAGLASRAASRWRSRTPAA